MSARIFPLTVLLLSVVGTSHADTSRFTQFTDQGDQVTTTWSPDGEWIAFPSSKGGSMDIWIIPSSGGTARQITHDSALEQDPAWSIDGTLIAYDAGVSSTSTGQNNIWVVPATGGIPRQLTASPVHDGVPDWSPDGRWLAFQSTRAGSMDIWIMPATGGTAYQITDMGDAYVPRWSPDGGRISFHRTPPRGKSNIWIADVSDLEGALANVTHQRIAGQVPLGGKPSAGVSLDVMAGEADPIEVTLNAGQHIDGVDFAQTTATWPLTTTLVLFVITALACVIPAYVALRTVFRQREQGG